MIPPRFYDGEALQTLRRDYRASRYPHVQIPHAFDENSAAELRARAAEGLKPFFVADRGHYAVNARLVDAPFFEDLRMFAERVIEAPLTVGPALWLRFVRGDYQLLRGDEMDRPERSHHIELTLDFSAAETGQAEIVYTAAPESFVLEQWPGSVALVERGDTLSRYDRYLNQLVGEAEVWRLRLALRL